MQEKIIKSTAYNAAVKVTGIYKVKVYASDEIKAKIVAAQMYAEADLGRLVLTDIIDMTIMEYDKSKSTFSIDIYIEGYYPVKEIISDTKEAAEEYAYRKTLNEKFGLLTDISAERENIQCTRVEIVRRNYAVVE